MDTSTAGEGASPNLAASSGTVSLASGAGLCPGGIGLAAVSPLKAGAVVRASIVEEIGFVVNDWASSFVELLGSSPDSVNFARMSAVVWLAETTS